jgi:hypothetical protein
MESPEVSLCLYGQLIFGKCVKKIKWRIRSSQICVWQLDISKKRMKSNLILYTKINSELISDSKHKPWNSKTPERKHRERSCLTLIF